MEPTMLSMTREYILLCLDNGMPVDTLKACMQAWMEDQIDFVSNEIQEGTTGPYFNTHGKAIKTLNEK